LEYLRRNYGMRKWIGVGHSCGGTLLLQVVGEGMGRGRYVGDIGEGGEAGQGNIRREGEEEVKGPQALILLEAIYSLPLFLHNHRPELSGDAIARIYRDIVTGAFGTDERVWEEASPVSGDYSGRQGGMEALKYIALAYSPEDELVEAEQRDVMLARLKECGWEEGELGDSGRVVEVRDISGSHDSMWEEGGVIAEEIIRVLDALRSHTDTN
jgi:kynurenine formamidase